MRNRDVIKKLQLELNDGWIFKTELHRPHKKFDRETFLLSPNDINRNTICRNSKHLHLQLIHINFMEKIKERFKHLIYSYKVSRSYGAVKNELHRSIILLTSDIVLCPNQNKYATDLFDIHLLYTPIKNLLFPINYKKAITLLNYESDLLLRTISRILILKKLDKEIQDEILCTF